MIRIGLRMRQEAHQGPATSLGGGSATAVLQPTHGERTGVDGLCDNCGAAWPCTRCGDRTH